MEVNQCLIHLFVFYSWFGLGLFEAFSKGQSWKFIELMRDMRKRKVIQVVIERRKVSRWQIEEIGLQVK